VVVAVVAIAVPLACAAVRGTPAPNEAQSTAQALVLSRASRSIAAQVQAHQTEVEAVATLIAVAKVGTSAMLIVPTAPVTIGMLIAATEPETIGMVTVVTEIETVAILTATVIEMIATSTVAIATATVILPIASAEIGMVDTTVTGSSVGAGGTPTGSEVFQSTARGDTRGGAIVLITGGAGARRTV